MSEAGEMLQPAVTPTSPRGTDLLQVLEDRIGELVDRHHEAQKRIAELQARAAASDVKVVELSGRMTEADQLREELRGRVGRLLARVAAIESESGEGV